ncbi:hypothetical protein JTE90_027866 [Oedothorax gibbosus]|uniref:RING-type domain-containing protein n=1 Tax=Oedothorax gibbosus TaxID=931172 RepID=A0AAV6U8W3_9ARAC|nr:hypothetical protein JTE90_027866 [Oedothorax gibbosus]
MWCRSLSETLRLWETCRPGRNNQQPPNRAGRSRRNNQQQPNLAGRPRRNNQQQPNLAGLPGRNNQQQPDLRVRHEAVQFKLRQIPHFVSSSSACVEIPEAELDDTKCGICVTGAREYKENRRPVARTDCGHFFCIPCIYNWKKRSSNCLYCTQPTLPRRGARGLYLFHVI